MPLHLRSVALLALLSLSDSFAAEWPRLAAACGLELVAVPDASGFARLQDAVGVIAGAGAEKQLEPAIRQGAQPGVPMAAVGALPDHRLSAALVRAGASEYFALPGDYELLRTWLRARADALASARQATAFAAGERRKYRFEGILGDSAALHAALERAARVIPRPGVTVLLAGETGTGKELMARAIHYEGPRHAKPFVDVNCAAIPEQLLESELFGHEKGAFTSATGTKPGLFELANGGTLFLDEIGHLAMPLQGKLLRVLEERMVRRVGGTRSTPIDVRVIAATHVDLAKAVRAGTFREDLYYRLNVVPIELPPLRARREDIVPLAEHFLRRFAAEYDMPPKRLAPAAAEALRARDWPGNVRELRNTIERAVLLASAPLLTPDDLEPAELHGVPAAGGDALPFPAPLHRINVAAAHRMVALCGGNKSEAARRLDISRPRLLRLLDVDPAEAAAATELDDPARRSLDSSPAPDDDHAQT